ncbi:hypothetical protein GYMLUDRAFT_65119 [Collybiopsis luxurians FD-317 M1]|uniref:Unplaced genomic scaffold GYMLUscaffold_134, whole genome shotgun sequence n=1 Tax=Collybiopsis luxurians FD-317 M1 TaxID=944289 RepID=A0A0D0AKU2_9AGAR|nr:hypothetical protein GYMLUDRAFT_65119 [Collybiopsis luxurians FD-317 M1]
MARSPRKSSRKTSGGKTPKKRSTATSSNKSGSRKSPLKRISQPQQSPPRRIASSIQVAPGAPFSQLEDLAHNLEAGNVRSTNVDPSVPNEDNSTPAVQTGDGNPSLTSLTPHDLFQTPARPPRRGHSLSLHPFTMEPNFPVINGEQTNQAESTGLNDNSLLVHTGESSLLPSSPPRGTPLPPGLSSPVTQTSPASSMSFPLSSPTKPHRNRATQKDPLFGRVKGAAKGSQQWNIVRDRPVPAPRTEVSESTRRYRCELEKIICCVSIYS